MNFSLRLPRIALSANGKPLPVDAALAETFISRLRGLSFLPRIPERFALLIRPCDAIHMFGMRQPLEAVFLSREGEVLKIARDLRPWTGLAFCCRAHAVLEWRPGSAERYGICEGDRIACSSLSATGQRLADFVRPCQGEAA